MSTQIKFFKFIKYSVWFQKITITQIQYISVQQILVVTFEYTGATRAFMIMFCVAREVKKVGQHSPKRSSQRLWKLLRAGILRNYLGSDVVALVTSIS